MTPAVGRAPWLGLHACGGEQLSVARTALGAALCAGVTLLLCCRCCCRILMSVSRLLPGGSGPSGVAAHACLQHAAGSKPRALRRVHVESLLPAALARGCMCTAHRVAFFGLLHMLAASSCTLMSLNQQRCTLPGELQVSAARRPAAATPLQQLLLLASCCSPGARCGAAGWGASVRHCSTRIRTPNTHTHHPHLAACMRLHQFCCTASRFCCCCCRTRTTGTCSASSRSGCRRASPAPTATT